TNGACGATVFHNGMLADEPQNSTSDERRLWVAVPFVSVTPLYACATGEARLIQRGFASLSRPTERCGGRSGWVGVLWLGAPGGPPAFLRCAWGSGVPVDQPVEVGGVGAVPVDAVAGLAAGEVSLGAAGAGLEQVDDVGLRYRLELAAAGGAPG